MKKIFFKFILPFNVLIGILTLPTNLLEEKEFCFILQNILYTFLTTAMNIIVMKDNGLKVEKEIKTE